MKARFCIVGVSGVKAFLLMLVIFSSVQARSIRAQSPGNKKTGNPGLPGTTNLPGPDKPAESRADSGRPASETEIVRVRIDNLKDSPTIGLETAPVTLVAFIDYQCPFCTEAHITLEEIARKYPEGVKFVFKQKPARSHPNAELAAQAALAARDLGKFPEMNRRLFENQDALKLEHLVKYADEIGLNANEFEVALISGAFAHAVRADAALARKLGVYSTPYFFINGRPLRGAKSIEVFEDLIDEELAGPRKPTRWVADLSFLRAQTKQDRAPVPANELPTVAVVSLDDDPVLGKREAKVGVVVFSDYQCPSSRKVAVEVLPSLKKAHIDTGEAQYILRDYPLKSHAQARSAAVAANCAARQDAYWGMHDALFAHKGPLGPGTYKELARSLKLDTAAFLACLEDPLEAQEVEKDFAYGNTEAIRVGSTPTFFVGRVEGGRLVNARKLTGAQTFETLSQWIKTLVK